MSFRFSMSILAAILMAGCGSSNTSTSNGTTPTTPSPAGSTITIVSGAQTLSTTAYSPNPMTVSVGTTVTWVNGDNTAHTATSNTGAFSTGTIPAGGSASHQFAAAGSFPYHCSFHPDMVATVNVQ